MLTKAAQKHLKVKLNRITTNQIINLSLFISNKQNPNMFSKNIIIVFGKEEKKGKKNLNK